MNTRHSRALTFLVVALVIAGLLACAPPGPSTGPGQPPAPSPVPSAFAGPGNPTAAPPTAIRTTPASTGTVIVDNADPGFTVVAGEWGTCKNGDCSGTCYGPDFRFADSKCTTCKARFEFNAPAADEYDVWAWWPQGDDRATDTPFVITVGRGAPLTVNVDQRNSGDDWFWLAQIECQAGELVRIEVAGSDTGFANADAVALTPAGSGPPGGPGTPAATPSAPPETSPTVPSQPTPTSPVQPSPTAPVSTPAAGGARTNLFFLHHSTGEGIINEGNVRGTIAQYNQAHGTHFELWDHGYNADGLRNPQGEPAGTYDIPDDNTDPVGLYNLWTTDNEARRKILANHQVIAFKSCFPASDIQDDETLAQYKTWYLAMRDVFDQHPDKVFVVMSQPPLHRLATEPAVAKRARQFANWLKSAEYLGGHPNIVCFDLFDQLAHADDGSAGANMLRYEYEGSHDNSDSHPNATANQAVGPRFAQFLMDAAQR
jgi:hypothetical protein